MSVEAILALVVGSLEELGVPYMVTGSLASAFYGEPRSTQDIDVVVNATEGRLQRVGERLREAGFYCDPGAISEAVALRGMFNAIDPATGWKVDFIVLKAGAFHRSAFDGRIQARWEGIAIRLSRPEDVVVSKLDWAKLGGSERQLQDVLGVLLVQGPGLDRAYIERWVGTLDLGDQWNRVLDLERAQQG